MGHDAAAGAGTEEFLQLAAADQVVLTDLFQSQGLVQVFFQVAQDLVDHIVISGTQLLGRQFRRFPPDQTNEQFLQGGTQQLFAAVWRMFRSLQPCDPGSLSGVEKAEALSWTILASRARSAGPIRKIRFRNSSISGEEQRKLITTRLGATVPLASSAWNSPGA